MQMCNWKCREREGETERERGAKASTEEVMAKKFAQIDKIHQFTNSRNPNSSAFKKERKKEKENHPLVHCRKTAKTQQMKLKFSFRSKYISLYIIIFSCFLSFKFWSCLETCGILVPWPRIEPATSALKVQILNHWITREDPIYIIIKRKP